MSKYKDHLVNQRFKKVFEELEKRNLIKGKSDIANQLGTYNHIVNSILKGQRNVTVDQLKQLFNIYQIDANYLFGLSDTMFVDEALTSIDKNELHYAPNANITLIPHKALAGVAIDTNEISQQEDLPRFSVPSMNGNLIGVEISGDSMMPTLANGDIVVCEEVERGDALRENNIYVIVTDVVVAKRIQQIRSEKGLTRLKLISDNSTVYKPYDLDLSEINHLFKVKCRLTSYGLG